MMSDDGLVILIIDDEQAIRRFLRAALSMHGHSVIEAVNGQQGLSAILTHRPDVVFLDLGLPDMDGIEIIKQLREWSQVPIIVLSVRHQEQIKIEALDLGADDYLTKPFSMGELMARMRVALRHATPADQEPVFTLGTLTVDLGRRLVLVDDREAQLTRTEYDLLRTMVVDVGKVLTRMATCFEPCGDGDTRSKPTCCGSILATCGTRSNRPPRAHNISSPSQASGIACEMNCSPPQGGFSIRK